MLSDPLAGAAGTGPELVPFCFWWPVAATQPRKARLGGAVAGAGLPADCPAAAAPAHGRLDPQLNRPGGDSLPSPAVAMAAGFAAAPAAAQAGAVAASAAQRLAPPPRPALPSPDPRRLRAAISAHLAAHGWRAAEPLRWAITAVDPRRGWQLEGVAVCAAAPFQTEPG